MENKQNSEYRTVRGYQMANQQEHELTSAMEDYLEMACKLCLENGYTRVGRLSELLNVRPSSASKMVSRLVEFGYLAYDPYESVLLTEKGQETGTYLLHRHDTLEQFLRLIGNASPLEEAELIEHSIGSSTVAQINVLLGFFTQNPGIKRYFEEFQKSDDGGSATG